MYLQFACTNHMWTHSEREKVEKILQSAHSFDQTLSVQSGKEEYRATIWQTLNSSHCPCCKLNLLVKSQRRRIWKWILCAGISCQFFSSSSSLSSFKLLKENLSLSFIVVWIDIWSRKRQTFHFWIKTRVIQGHLILSKKFKLLSMLKLWKEVIYTERQKCLCNGM